MKPSEFRELSADELPVKLRELRDELFSAKVKHSTGQLENTQKLCALRRDIARGETVGREKSRADR